MDRLEACLKYCELKNTENPDYTENEVIWLAIKFNER